MTNHIENRDIILEELRAELIGPSPQGEVLDCSSRVDFESKEEFYKPWRQINGEEILQRDPPTKRYGIGVLYPYEVLADDQIEDAGNTAIGLFYKEDQDSSKENINSLKPRVEADIKKIKERESKSDDGLSDLDLTSSNTYRPSTIGISFLSKLTDDSKITVEASLGRYKPLDVSVDNFERRWWLRIPIMVKEQFSVKEILKSSVCKIEKEIQKGNNTGPINLWLELYSRPHPNGNDPGEKLITLCLVNRTIRSNYKNLRNDELCTFQSKFRVTVTSANGENVILPYPEASAVKPDSEERSLNLLYRNYQTYAVGHGCAADWGKKDGKNRVKNITAECLPVFETPSVTPEIEDENGNPIKVSMAHLAGLVDKENGFNQLERVIRSYEEWITKKNSEILNLPNEDYIDTAKRHLGNCTKCAKRMREGLKYLKKNPKAFQAFKLANHAILLQQLVNKNTRLASYDSNANRWEIEGTYTDPTTKEIPPDIGKWRAFQIAFILMSIKSTIDIDDADRETVELIWFPTGGGKTEAYLGLASFALFYRRLSDPEDTGVHVITRYTLRLLTAQQFQRTSRLICAMDYLRQKTPNLGVKPFSIGIWVGGDNTPNTIKDAIATLNKLKRGDKYTENKFILTQCPWCGAQMGPIRKKDGKKWVTDIAGYYRFGNTVSYRCPDNHCHFNHGLPIYVIDEDIYEQKPSIVIGTVDKFAMLAWKPEARSLFGFDSEGARINSPPGLIIQDELHLISGPLGSMVGLYESIIEELCTDRRYDKPIVPKIISSTATIRRYMEQVKALYARNKVNLFPPPGINTDDSFFAKYARDDTGELKPGRKYVGIHGPGLGSLQTVQVRAFTALLQGPMSLDTKNQQDPWWTLLIFFNSLRELGTTLSLLQSDIPDYLKVTKNRMGIDYKQLRNIWRIRELTGRLKSDEVPEALSDLEISRGATSRKKAIDTCLASNILEVGVDIERLSLMAVVGQPKSTSQYIQVTGRVGRKWWEKPGLVATIYSASKPRDRSHFEKFRSYHERLYAQVEPTSVTPFSPPALDRALHAIMVLYVRQIGSKERTKRPYPYPKDLIEQIRSILLPRVREVDPVEVESFEKIFKKRSTEWKKWKRTVWEKKSVDDSFLIRYAGDYAEGDSKFLSWPVPTSMRNVDAECQSEITSLYLQENEGELD